MNDAYNESKDEGQLAWLKQWSEVIAGKRLLYVLRRFILALQKQNSTNTEFAGHRNRDYIYDFE